MFYVASRGHHADIGGITPGSMPPHSTALQQEGAVFLSFKLVQGGVFQEEGEQEWARWGWGRRTGLLPAARLGWKLGCSLPAQACLLAGGPGRWPHKVVTGRLSEISRAAKPSSTWAQEASVIWGRGVGQIPKGLGAGLGGAM